MDITSLSLVLLGFAVLPPSFSIIVLFLRGFVSSAVSIYRIPARAHLLWLPDSPFLRHQSACPAAGCSPDLVALHCMETLPVARHRSKADPVACAFCLAAVEEGDEVRELRCEHLFHRDCLDRWLCHRRRTCPLCRGSLLP
ncbi:unnamed protein product [Spirodela intermedia]|uniref:RING-type domain-containing protein n=1 Tax=Spirodela intermedia TaxID=51605 RepID=A0A7I8JHF6_SPIIN|nr:unnamed protein product [Spirodela intermedia]CAA6669185.1 unnamed protein product [Spirodela intermedia]